MTLENQANVTTGRLTLGAATHKCTQANLLTKDYKIINTNLIKNQLW